MVSVPHYTSQDTLDYAPLIANLNATFASGKTRSLDWRRQQLVGLSRMLDEEADAVYAALEQDLGKCKAESFVAELGFLQADIKHTLKHLGKWQKPRKVSTPVMAQPGKSYQYPQPLGTVLIIGAWNYPLQLTLAPAIAAIAAGNCMVLKPSELAEATSAFMARAIPKYMDSDAIAVVEGGKDETTALLTLAWDHIFYTGGEMVGKIVMRAAAEHLTPVTLELGGKSPCVIDTATNLTVAARRVVWGKWMNAGQTCIAPDYVLIEQALLDPFLDALKKALEEQYGANPLASDDYGNIINARHLARLRSYLEDVNVIIGGDVDEAQNRLAPTVVLNPSTDAKVMQDEIFGPILPIVTVESMDHAIAFINNRPRPLALYLFTDSDKLEQQFLNQTTAGNMCINDTMMFMTNPELPFGGVGNSGMGSYHGRAGFDTFSHLKTVMKRSFWLDAPVRYAPFKSWKLSVLKKLL